MDTFLLDNALRSFLTEDLEHGDITTEAIFTPQDRAQACFMARHSMTVVGMETVAARVFSLLDPLVVCTAAMADGSRVEAGDELLCLRGATRTLLRGERVALNLVQRLCGIATLTAAFVDAAQGLKAKIVDTRKTTPGLRMLEKYAVGQGGGYNHRLGLFDRIMVKDNHLAAGSAGAAKRLTAFVERARASRPDLIVEVEVDRLDQIKPVVTAGADIVLLDNFSIADLREAIPMLRGKAWSEVSGGVNIETLGAIGTLSPDFVSCGGITHSAPWCDLGMDWS